MSDYPYPKLRGDLDDYPDSRINCDISTIDSGGVNLIVKGEFNILNNGINQLIEEGNAGYCLFIQCNYTKITEFVPVEKRFMYKIIKSYYTGEIEITPGVYMKEEIKGYTNEDLNSDYDDTFIVLPKGAMIAEADHTLIKLFRESMVPGSSICDFVIDKEYRYTDTTDKITIGLPKDIFELSNTLRNAECSQIFTSMYVYPVILDVVGKHWFYEKEEASTTWYVTLDEMIINLHPEGLSNCNPFDLTTEILQSMLFDSTKYLAKHYGDRNEY